MQVQIIHGDSVFSDLAHEWDTLARRGMTDTPFQHLAYQQAWWQYLQPDNASLHTVAVRHDNGELIGIACLYVYDGLVHFNGCVEETDYLDLIAAESDAESVWTAVFDALLSSEFPQWHTIDLCNVPAASLSRQIVPRLAAEHNLEFNETIHEVCPIITLPATFDEYLEMIDSKQRREIRRKMRRAQGADAQLVIVSAQDDVETAVNDFLDLLTKSTFEKRDWLNDGRRAVFHATAKAAQADGTLLLMFMEVNGRKASALFNFDYNNAVLVYNSGLDPAAFGQLSLGEVLTAKAIEWSIENGRTIFDFLRGDEAYKYRFGAADTTIYKLRLQKNA
ncbi:MAG: GNAT family N-acetyltransferase [Anaerolineales bacterium]|nr:GNAT family N-acetyltransferase [Anaerolineales bacterium]MCB8966072.1 GNAT family N-acetyltransferase [Ardenticatenaceae bacterium]